MDLFLHPWYMVAGGALISSPIIIHLINRMRFKRIRWAAMEFLLKSQKRNRRRLIIEQMILLLLRILLVLLIAFLVARFIGAALGNTAQGTMHVVILDDTMSMGDHWRQEAGGTRTSMDVARDQIKQLARNAALASSAQVMQLYLLSDLATPIYNKRLDDRSEQELTERLNNVKPTALHIDPVKGVIKSKDIFNSAPQGQKVLHLVSDFRDTDWGTSDRLEELNEKIKELLDAGVNLSLIDTAHPFRNETKGVALNHDNLAITDFKSDSRIAAENMPVEFTVTVRNHSTKEVTDAFLKVSVEGKEDFTVSPVKIDKLPGGEKTEIKFKLSFPKKTATTEFIPITAEVVERDPTGLLLDNVRDLVIEVRKKIPALVIDGEGLQGYRTRGGDSFDLEAIIYTEKSFQAEVKTLDDLDKVTIEDYPCIFLLNVGQIKNEALLDRLQHYVQNGGSIAYFLGDKISAGFYNDTLHKKYNGLFPAMLESRPTDPPPAEEHDKRRLDDPQPKILFRNPRHPIIQSEQGEQGELVKNLGELRYLSIDRYYPTQPRSQWNPETEKERAEEIITLPNRRSIDDYKARAQELARQAVERTRELAEADRDYQKFIKPVEGYQRAIVRALDTGVFYYVVLELDRLLQDPGEQGKAERPAMADLWAHPQMAQLKKELERFRENIQYGDPLVVVRPYGRGKVAACMTTAGVKSKWNDWAEGPVAWSYVIFVKKLLRYLNSESADLNRLVTDEAGIKLQFDPAQYKEQVKVEFQPQPDPTAPKGEGVAGEPPPLEKWTITMGSKTVGQTQTLNFQFNDARRPGVYSFKFEPSAANKPVETRSYAFNVDTSTESDLRRATTDRLLARGKMGEGQSARAFIINPGEPFDKFKQRDPDASESPWLYLLFLLVLVAEQALAVHLSFHVNPSETAVPARTPRPAPAAA